MSTAGALRRATQSLVGASKAISTPEPFSASRLTRARRDSSTSWIIAVEPVRARAHRQPKPGHPFGRQWLPEGAALMSPSAVRAYLVSRPARDEPLAIPL